MNRTLKCKMKKGKGSMIYVATRIQKTGQHTYKKLKNEIITDLQQAHDAYIICLMLHVQVTAKGFGPILKIFDMTFQTS